MLDPTTLSEILETWPGLRPLQAYRFEEREDRQPVVHAIRIWPDPESFLLGVRGDQWLPFVPPIPGAVLADPYDVQTAYWDICAWNTDLRPFLAQIPDHIRDSIRPYEGTDAWEALRLLSWIGDVNDQATTPGTPEEHRG